MIRFFKYLLLVTISLIILNNCIDEIGGVVDGYEDLIVVEGMLTNEDTEYTIKLSRTSADVNVLGDPVEGASVSVEDGKGNKFDFKEENKGIYVSDDDQFRGEINETYQLTIQIKEGDTYQSEWCVLNEPGEIDSIYFEKRQYYSSAERRNMDGVSIYADGKSCSENDDVSLRWKCYSTWKFMVQYPTYHKLYSYAPDSVTRIPYQNKFCWKSSVTDNINIYSFKNTNTKEVTKQHMLLLRPSESDVVSIRYSVLVKQYSISLDEYNFWRNIKETTQETGDIFGKQPYTVVGNIKNITTPSRRAVGFFRVAGVTSKRTYIDRAEVSKMKIPVETFVNHCPVDTGLIDSARYTNIYDVYNHFVVDSGAGLVDMVTNLYTGEILGLRVTNKKCNDCTKTGSGITPSFWEE